MYYNYLSISYRFPPLPTLTRSSTSYSILFSLECIIHYLLHLYFQFLTHIALTHRCTGTTYPSGPCLWQAFFPDHSLSYIYLRDDATPTTRKATSQVVFTTHLLTKVVFTTDKENLHRPWQDLRDSQDIIEGFWTCDIINHA